MTNLIMITHELVTLEQINSKRIYSHLYNNGIATSELTIDYHFWSQFAFLQMELVLAGTRVVHIRELDNTKDSKWLPW